MTTYGSFDQAPLVIPLQATPNITTIGASSLKSKEGVAMVTYGIDYRGIDSIGRSSIAVAKKVIKASSFLL